MQAKHDPANDDVLLADVCIATSAAPYYFPHYFEHKPSHGVPRKFNLVNSGVAANNPVHSYSLTNLFDESGSYS